MLAHTRQGYMIYFIFYYKFLVNIGTCVYSIGIMFGADVCDLSWAILRSVRRNYDRCLGQFCDDDEIDEWVESKNVILINLNLKKFNRDKFEWENADNLVVEQVKIRISNYLSKTALCIPNSPPIAIRSFIFVRFDF